MSETIGFIGLGLMGSAMAMRLQKAGYKLLVHNRTKEKAEPLLPGGAEWCDSPALVAERTKIILSMISDSHALEEIAAGENGLLREIKKGAVHVDMSTVSPNTASLLAVRYSRAEASFLHSPVLGSIPNVNDGSLLLFVGGDEDAFKTVEKVLQVLGKKTWRFERAEQASHMKLLCNSFIAGMIVTLAQALVYADRAEIDPRTLLEVISHSALNAPMYQTKGASMIDRNFHPRFFVDHMLKDITLAIESGKNLRISQPGLDAAQALFSEARSKGFSKEDYSAVLKVLEGMTPL